MRDYIRYWPAGVFEDKDGVVVPCKFVSLDQAAASSNVQAVAAVTGKKIKVLKITVSSDTVETQIRFKNGSGGGNLYFIVAPDITLNPPNADIDGGLFGLCETSAGTGLYFDTGAGDDVHINLTYIEV